MINGSFYLIVWERGGLKGYLKHIDFFLDVWIENPFNATPFHSSAVPYITTYYSDEDTPGVLYLQEVKTNFLTRMGETLKVTELTENYVATWKIKAT